MSNSKSPNIKGKLAAAILVVVACTIFWSLPGFCDPCNEHQRNFQFTENTGTEYSITVQSISGDVLWSDCSEVAVYDGDLCVGGVVFQEPGLLGMVAWPDNPQTDEIDGYTAGNQMSFKIWENETGRTCNAEATFTSGLGLFERGDFCSLTLKVLPEGPGIPKIGTHETPGAPTIMRWQITTEPGVLK